MKYLCLIYENEAASAAMPKDELGKMFGEYHAFTSDVKSCGQYLGGEALQPTSTATTVRVRGGKVQTTDGPFAETKEQLGGFYLVEARDLTRRSRSRGASPARSMEASKCVRSSPSTPLTLGVSA